MSVMDKYWLYYLNIGHVIYAWIPFLSLLRGTRIRPPNPLMVIFWAWTIANQERDTLLKNLKLVAFLLKEKPPRSKRNGSTIVGFVCPTILLCKILLWDSLISSKKSGHFLKPYCWSGDLDCALDGAITQVLNPTIWNLSRKRLPSMLGNIRPIYIILNLPPFHVKQSGFLCLKEQLKARLSWRKSIDVIIRVWENDST